MTSRTHRKRGRVDPAETFIHSPPLGMAHFSNSEPNGDEDGVVHLARAVDAARQSATAAAARLEAAHDTTKQLLLQRNLLSLRRFRCNAGLNLSGEREQSLSLLVSEGLAALEVGRYYRVVQIIQFNSFTTHQRYSERREQLLEVKQTTDTIRQTLEAHRNEVSKTDLVRLVRRFCAS